MSVDREKVEVVERTRLLVEKNVLYARFVCRQLSAQPRLFTHVKVLEFVG